MIRPGLFALLTLTLVLATGSVGQDNKKEQKPAPKDEPEVKYKGVLPRNWSKLGLSEIQKQEIYKVQTKYNKEIDALEEKIKELKAAKAKDEKAVLTAEQKKRLEVILLGKE